MSETAEGLPVEGGYEASDAHLKKHRSAYSV
jgi:hypothetical protein